jgi:hypothetical protein
MLTPLIPVRKLSLIWCIVIPAVVLCPDVIAQKKLSDTPLSIDVKGMPLSELLTFITTKSGIPFSYNPKKISADKKITYKATNKSLTYILDELAATLGLKYNLVEDQIILQPEKKSEKKNIPTITLSGNIKDKTNGEALIGATVLVKELQAGTVTNAFGFYSLTIPTGAYTVASSFVGYREHIKTINLTASLNEDILLTEAPPVLQEIVISVPVHDLVKDIQSSSINIKTTTVDERPALLGENDVIKSLESVPGIKLHSDGSTYYYVRGGNRDQNLVLVDGAPIYNPSHLLGIFSTILPDAVNDITVYKGDMPASLGGRLSSVLNVQTKKGNDQHLQIWGSTGLISTKIGVEGPIKKNRSSYFVSARASSLEWLLKAADKNIKQFNFYDLTGKINFQLNRTNRLFFSTYTGGDNYFTNSAGIAWTNTAGSLQWNHLFTDKLFLNTTLALGSYDYYLHTDVSTNTRWTSHISNFNLKSDLSYFRRPENEYTFGWSINGYNFNPGNLKSDDPIPPGTPILSVRNSLELVVYGNHEIKLSDYWGVNYGIRLSSWSNRGEAFEYVFDELRNPVDTLYYKKGEAYKRYLNAEPRLTLGYLLNEKSSVKASYARNVQNVHLISNSTSPFTSLEVWLPSGINIKPQLCNQFTLGYYHSLPEAGMSISAETFYKKMTHQIDYNAHAETFLNPLVERDLRFGSATAYGLEVLGKKDAGRLRGWAGYTYSRAKKKFDAINGGRAYNAFYDRPHQVNLMASYDFSLRWNVGANWIYATGAPFSSPVSFYRYNDEEVPVYGEKNNDRLPAYHRLDLSATFKLNKNPEKRFKHSISFSVFNIYGRRNALFVNYNKIETADDNYKIPANLLEAERTTSQFYLFRFMPSFSYNFKFL